MRNVSMTVVLGLLTTVGLTMASCGEQSVKTTTPTKAPGASSSDALCTTMAANSVLTSANFLSLKDRLCGANGVLATLRTASNIYAGGTSTKILGLDTAASNTTITSMLTHTSVKQTTSPAKYFAMMRLQSEHPSDFKGKGFYVDPLVVYDVTSTTGDKTVFHYQRNDDQDTFGYPGETQFLTLVQDKTYVVAMRSTAKGDMVQSTSGLVVINLASDGKTEVFSLSDQVVENQGNGPAVVSKAKTNMGTEQQHSWDNGELAKQKM